MMKRIYFLLFVAAVFWGGTAFAGYFEFVEPAFEERVLTEQVQNGESILINVNTVAVDNRGNVYYLKSDLPADPERKMKPIPLRRWKKSSIR